MPEPDPRWSLHATPNPSEKAFSVVIGNSEISDALAQFDAYLEGSLFSAFPLIPDEALAQPEQFGNYVFTACMAQGLENMRFFFNKDKTTAQANAPFRVTTIDFGNHHWPAILKALNLQEDPFFSFATTIISGNNQGVATAPRYYQQEEYIQDVNEGSKFVLYEFYGPRPFIISRYPVPMPGRISYQTVTSAGSFPECLHDDVEIPATRTATSQNAGGTTTAVGGSLDGQFFPRTNFKSWRPYVFKCGQNQSDVGGWYKKLIRVFPPRLPRRIRENS